MWWAVCLSSLGRNNRCCSAAVLSWLPSSRMREATSSVFSARSHLHPESPSDFDYCYPIFRILREHNLRKKTKKISVMSHSNKKICIQPQHCALKYFNAQLQNAISLSPDLSGECQIYSWLELRFVPTSVLSLINGTMRPFILFYFFLIKECFIFRCMLCGGQSSIKGLTGFPNYMP